MLVHKTDDVLVLEQGQHADNNSTLLPVSAHYEARGVLRAVNGDQAPELVWAETELALGSDPAASRGAKDVALPTMLWEVKISVTPVPPPVSAVAPEATSPRALSRAQARAASRR